MEVKEKLTRTPRPFTNLNINIGKSLLYSFARKRGRLVVRVEWTKELIRTAVCYKERGLSLSPSLSVTKIKGSLFFNVLQATNSVWPTTRIEICIYIEENTTSKAKLAMYSFTSNVFTNVLHQPAHFGNHDAMWLGERLDMEILTWFEFFSAEKVFFRQESSEKIRQPTATASPDYNFVLKNTTNEVSWLTCP